MHTNVEFDRAAVSKSQKSAETEKNPAIATMYGLHSLIRCGQSCLLMIRPEMIIHQDSHSLFWSIMVNVLFRW